MNPFASFRVGDSQLNIFKQRFEAALKTAKMAVWEWYPQTDDFKSFGYEVVKTRTDDALIPFESYLSQVHFEDQIKIRELLTATIKHNIAYRFTFRVMLPDGKIEWISATGKAYYNKQGFIECVKGVDVVTTAFKNASIFASQHQEELAHMDRLHSMGTMASSLAHELTQPLTVIHTYISACILRLSDDIYSKKKQVIIDGLRKAGDQISRMGSIIQNMKNFVRKGAGVYEAISVNRLLQEAVFFFEHTIDSKKIHLQVDYEKNLSMVLVDSVKIQQVLINLVRNAAEALQLARAVEPKIHIYTTKLNESSIAISIQDNGIGIDEAITKKLFTPYFTTRPDGLGIGLAICRAIIEAHKGDIRAFNSSEGGAIFQFTLPVISNAD